MSGTSDSLIFFAVPSMLDFPSSLCDTGFFILLEGLSMLIPLASVAVYIVHSKEFASFACTVTYLPLRV